MEEDYKMGSRTLVEGTHLSLNKYFSLKSISDLSIGGGFRPTLDQAALHLLSLADILVGTLLVKIYRDLPS